MVNRREFLVAAVATSGVSKLAESKQATDGEARREGPISYSALPTYLPPGCVKVGGELGRRIDMTINKNVLILDADQDFLKPLQERTRKSGYIGLGKLIDASARLARYTGDERVLTLKRHIVAETLKTQEKDGYIGYLLPENRVWDLWDISEMGYIVYGLTMDHRLYGETASLEGARKLADYIIARWSAEPDHVIGGNIVPVRMAAVGLENAMLALYEETKDTKYLAFVRDFRKIADWDGRIVLGRWGKIDGHAYTYLAQCIAQLRLDRRFGFPVEPRRHDDNRRVWRPGMLAQHARGDDQFRRDMRHRLRDLLARRVDEARKQLAVRRPDGALDIQYSIRSPVPRRPPAPLLHRA
jgi:hypothetical protein